DGARSLGAGRRDARARRDHVRDAARPRPLAGPPGVPRGRLSLLRRRALRRLSRARRSPGRRLGHAGRVDPVAGRPLSCGDDRLLRARRADDTRRGARAQPVPGGAARVTRFEAPRGTHDILPSEQPLWQWATGAMQEVCALYGYRRIDTPGIEDTELIIRTAGGGSDVVQKETYTFEDRGGR